MTQEATQCYSLSIKGVADIARLKLLVLASYEAEAARAADVVEAAGDVEAVH